MANSGKKKKLKKTLHNFKIPIDKQGKICYNINTKDKGEINNENRSYYCYRSYVGILRTYDACTHERL